MQHTLQHTFQKNGGREMKKITYVSILILCFSFVTMGWSAGLSNGVMTGIGQGLSQGSHDLMQFLMWQQEQKLEQERLELQRKAQEDQQKIEQEKVDRQKEAQQNNSGAYVANPRAAKTITDMDGTDWNNFNELNKAMYVCGYVSSALYVVIDSYITPPKDYDRDKGFQLMFRISDGGIKKENTVFSKEDIILMMNHISAINNDRVRQYGLFQITIGQIVSGLDVLYKDFRNVRISISDAIYVVKKQIEGLSNEDTETILLYLRGGKKDFDILFIKDKEGKIVRWLSFP